MPVPLITCVVPTLNSGQTLETTILSLKAQLGVEVEITVVDSGSTDRTIDICRQWNLTTLYTPPGNMYRAINRGLKQGNAAWVTYLNSDDWLYPDSFARMIERGEAAPADVVYGNCDYVDAAGRFIYSFTSAQPEQLLPLFRLGRMGFAQPAAIFRRNVYERQGGFNESYRFKADADFFICLLRAKARYSFLDGPTVSCFRIHEAQLSIQKRELIEVEGERLFDASKMNAKLLDRIALERWRLRNLPNYAIRLLRASVLSRHLRFPRALDSYSHR